jgi:hypothetical protein
MIHFLTPHLMKQSSFQKAQNYLTKRGGYVRSKKKKEETKYPKT